MKWTDTRNKLLQLASRRHQRRELGARHAALQGADAAPSEPGPPGSGGPVLDERLGRAVRAASLCVASGKGGTGKSVVSAALVDLLAAHRRTLLVDADYGVGNAHILQDVSPPRTAVDVIEGNQSLRDVLVPCSERVDLIAAGSGVPRMAALTNYELHLLAAGLEDLERAYGYLVVDSAAGVSRQTVTFAAACDVTLVVTTPDLTAMTDAYAFLKVLMARTSRKPLLLVNRAQGEDQAHEVIARILGVCERFLGARPVPVGYLPDDAAVRDCVNRRGSFVRLEPSCRAARALRRVAVGVLEHLDCQHPRGLGRSLLAEVGYANGMA